MSRAPRSKEARRFWGDDDSDVGMLHVDMDAFFVSVELLDRPELAGKPVAVGGAERGVVSAASYEAREFGVNSAMPVARALRACPHLTMIPPRHDRYSEVSRQIMDILHDVTPLVEKLSVDEAFLDVGGARRLMGGPVRIAKDLRARIRREVGVPASVGIAATKHVAKIASAHAKPDGLLLIPRSATIAFLHGLPVGALWGVGEKTRARLANQGIETVGELADAGPERLTRILGRAHGTHLYRLAMGQDPRPVQTSREEKSIGKEVTFFEHVADRGKLEKILLAQAHATARRLRRAGLTARTVAIKVRFADFTTITRSTTFARPTDLAADLYTGAKRLFDSVAVSDDGLRLLGLRAEQTIDPREGIQLALGADSDDEAWAFGGESDEGIHQAFGVNPRLERAEAALDRICDKFGPSFAGPGSLIGANEERRLEADKEADRERLPENRGGGRNAADRQNRGGLQNGGRPRSPGGEWTPPPQKL